MNRKNEMKIALTFDDGPSEATPQILEILARRKIPATFFMIGQRVRRHPEIARQVLQAGHQIGHHSHSHDWRLLLGGRRLAEDLDEADRAFREVLGIRPRFFRAPRGLMPPWMRQTVARRGMVPVAWTLMPGDYWPWHSATRIVKRTLRALERTHTPVIPSGSEESLRSPETILVLHDGLNLRENPDRSATLEALPKICDGLLSEKYNFTLLDHIVKSEPYLPLTPPRGPC